MKKTVIKVMVAASMIAAKGIVSPVNAQTWCFPTMQVISNNDPTVTFSVDPGCPPASGCVQIYNWNFGDGTSLSTTSPTVAHTYTANGNYWASVCPVDSCSSGGASNSYSCTAVNIAISGNSGSGGGGTGGGGNICFPTLQIISSNGPTYTFSVNTGCTTNTGCVTYYNWNFGDGTILSTTTPTVSYTYSSSGSYWVSVCPYDSCTSGTANTYTCDVVQVNPSGGTGTYTCSTSLYIVADSLNPGNYWYYYAYTPSNSTVLNYQWFVGNNTYTTTANGPSPIFNLPAGTYTVCLTLTLTNGNDTCSSYFCSVVSDSTNSIFLYKMGTTGIKSTSSTINALIYPNPAKDVLFVKVNDATKDEINLQILDLSGRVIKSTSVMSDGSINISDVQIGTYILRINTPKGGTNKLWIKE
jgi:predicted RNase H-like HicB family nuclease